MNDETRVLKLDPELSPGSSDKPSLNPSDYPVIRLVRELCDRLEQEDVRYCHWKSNNAIDRTAAGDNDLDLLVNRSDVSRFTGALNQLGFRATIDPPHSRLPGVQSFYGYDAAANKLVHVHAHYQLVVGDDMTKNYRLPFEDAYLGSAVYDGQFWIARPEFELIVLVVRMILKHNSWDAILTLQGKMSKWERAELNDLADRSNPAVVNQLLKNHVPCIEPELFDACRASLAEGCSWWRRMLVAHKLMSVIRADARRPRTQDLGIKMWRRVTRAIRRRIWGPLPKSRMASGGTIIALVGGDGAGKSTSIAELRDWLSREFDIKTTHLGRPARSLTTNVVRAFLKAGRALCAPLGQWPGFAKFMKKNLAASELWWHVCTGRDRYRLYVKTRRFASDGGIVICDRFPLEQVKLMDGPQNERITNANKRNRLVRYLVRLEKKWYRSIVSPELLIVLKLDPEIAVRRKPEEVPSFVRERSDEIWRLDWSDSEACVIDASQPRANVMSQLKSLVWSSL